MGVLNVPPDSFSDGGKFIDLDTAVLHAKRMVAEGADIIDIGGESSRPGSDPVSLEDELARVVPVIERLSREIAVPLSIDTTKPEVARVCLQTGASILNDINGLRDPDMIQVAAQAGVPVIIMHMQGKPKTMQENPVYTDVVTDINNFFVDRIAAAHAAGIQEIIIDPGIGFGKTLDHNLEIFRRLREFSSLACPILMGPSRKSFIGKITGLDVADRLEGTIAAVTISILNGASIVRVHDVKECKRAAMIADAVVMDSIILNGMHVQCHLGITEEERVQAQEVIVDLRLSVDMGRAREVDHIDHTVNYSTVHQSILKLLGSRSWNLLETVAEAVADTLLQTFPIQQLTVRVQKPSALIQKHVDWVGVEITRP